MTQRNVNGPSGTIDETRFAVSIGNATYPNADESLVAWRKTMKIDMTELAKWMESTILETTIGKRAGTPITFQMPVKDLPLVSLVKMLIYGAQRWINDPIGGKDVTLEEKTRLVREFLPTVMDGTWVHAARKNAATGVSQFVNEARRMYRADLDKPERKRLDAMPDHGVAEMDAAIAKLGEAFAAEVYAKIAADEVAARAETERKARVAAMKHNVEV